VPVRENAILTLLKTIGIFTLALFVFLVFFQRIKLENKAEAVKQKVSQLDEKISGLATKISLLDRTIKKQGLRAPAPSNGGGTAPIPVIEGLPEPDQVDAFAWSKSPPPWLKGRAKELWGKHDNYLKPDPDWPKTPDLEDPKVDPSGEVTLWYGSAPADLNPLTLSDGSVQRYVSGYCDQYLARSHSQNPYLYRGELAYRIEVSPDYRTWTYWLRPGVKWHTPQVDLDEYPHLKGEHFFTAHDWKFTIDLIMNKDVKAAHHRSYYQDYDRCEVVDDHCFIMHWHKSSFTSINANMELVTPKPKFVFAYDETGEAFEPASLGKEFNEHWIGKTFRWVGCGPYILEHYDKESMRVVRNDEFWGDLPAIKKLTREMFPDRSLSYTKFEAGEFSFASYLAPAFEKRLANRPEYKDGRIKAFWAKGTAYPFIAYKNTHRIFKDHRVRRAMTHACDRKRMLQLVNLGRGDIIHGPQSAHSPTYPKDITPLAYDLEMAKALLAEAGWKDADGNGVLEKEIDGETVEFRVKAMIPQNPTFNTIFDVFGEDLSKIGVDMSAEPVEWSLFSKNLDDRNFEICALYWDTTGWDSDMTQIWHSSMIRDAESSNFIEFGDDEVDRLIEAARAEFNLEKRIEVQSAAHRRINELQPYTFLFNMETAVAWWTDQVADVDKGFAWRSKPFLRSWPLYVPAKK
jgi:ABC-type transport system substrate-binding protein